MGSTSSTIVNILAIVVVIWIIVLIISVITLSRRKDILMPVKAFWGVVLFMAPVVGLVFYLLYSFRKKGGGITRY